MRAKVPQSTKLIQGLSLIFASLQSLLFDSRATHSFIYHVCVFYLRLSVSELPFLLVVSTPTSRSLATNYVLPLQEIDIILGID